MAWGKCEWPVESVDGLGLVWAAWDGCGRLEMGVEGLGSRVVGLR